MPESVGQRPVSPPPSSAADIFAPLGAALLNLPEPERFRVLGDFLVELAGRQEAAARAPGAPDLDGLSKRLQRLGEEKAQLDDALAAAGADLALRCKQLEAEQQRSQEMERILGEQRNRLQASQKELGELEAQLVARNKQVHDAENQVEQLSVKLQRAELKAGDSSRVNALEEGKRGLAVQVEQLRKELDQLRADKDAAIEKLKAEAASARASSGTGGDALLSALWERLAQAKPPLAPGGIHPNDAAAQRLMDAFVELARFVNDFDQALRPFLTTFIKHIPALARAWDAYVRSPGLHDVVREIIDVEHGKPAGVLKMRLLGLQRWAIASIIGSDTAIESIAHELEQHLRGSVGMETDPNRRLRDYIRDDGHHLFHQQMRELRNQKLAEAYTHGHGG
jgi:hypothetical protein